MDPNETLAEIRKLITLVGRGRPAGFQGNDTDYAEQVAAELAAHVTALDEWISRGGFLPSAWQR